MNVRLKLISVCLFAMALLAPESVRAFQSHPAPEGLYVHQLAHVIYIIAMSAMAYWLQVNGFVRSKGWRLIQISCVLLILWNLVAFTGHWVEEKIPDASVVGKPGWNQRILLGLSPWTPLFYVLKLDHLVSVPAIVCLFLGIRLLYRETLKKEEQPDG